MFRDYTEEFGGQVIFGGSDPDLYEGEFDYHEVVDGGEDYWKIQIDSLAVGDDTSLGCVGGCLAPVDTGTSVITGPVEEIRAIHEVIGGFEILPGEYIINCNNLDEMPDLTFTITGVEYVLAPEEYVLIVSGNYFEYYSPHTSINHLFTTAARNRRSDDLRLWAAGPGPAHGTLVDPGRRLLRPVLQRVRQGQRQDRFRRLRARSVIDEEKREETRSGFLTTINQDGT